MVISLCLLTFFSQILISFSADCLVPDTDTFKFEIFSTTLTDVVDSNSNYLKKAVPPNNVWENFPRVGGATLIWDQADNYNTGTKYFKHEFYILGTPIEGTLLMACDDSVVPKINGLTVSCNRPNFNSIYSCSVKQYLKSGWNTAIFASSNGGGEGIFEYKFKLESRI